MHVTVSKRFEAKVAAARDALSHARPGATTEEILEAALDLLLERAAKRRGMVEKPRKAPTPAKPDHIPAHVKRAVMERDGGRCQFVLPPGEICGSTHRLEFDHVRPLALGGGSTVENLRLCCRPHNQGGFSVTGGAPPMRSPPAAPLRVGSRPPQRRSLVGRSPPRRLARAVTLRPSPFFFAPFTPVQR